MDEFVSSPVRKNDELSGLVFYSLLAAATALIPIPLLDDWSYGVTRRRMAREIFRRRGIATQRITLKIALGQYDEDRPGGCLYKVLFTLVIVPLRIVSRFVRDLFRKILIFLAVKQASDWASAAFHEGYLLQHAAAKLAPGDNLGRSDARRMRYSIRLTLRGLNTSPVWNVFYGIIRLNRSLLRTVASRVSRIGKQARARTAPEVEEASVDEYLRQERRFLDDVVNRLADLLAGQRGYLVQLESRFDHFYRDGGPGVPPMAGRQGSRPV